MIRKDILVYIIVFLILSLTPATAVQLSEINSNDLEKSFTHLDENMDKMNETYNNLTSHITVVLDKCRYLKENSWKFWEYKQLLNEIIAIKEELQISNDLVNELVSDSQNMDEISKEIDGKFVKFQESNDSSLKSLTDANKMAKELENKSGVKFTVSDINELEKDDIVQVRTKNGHYMYLSFIGMDNKNNTAIFQGNKKTITKIPKSSLNINVQHKLMYNVKGNKTDFNKEIIDQGSQIQQNEINLNRATINNLKGKIKQTEIKTKKVIGITRLCNAVMLPCFILI